MAYCRFGSSDAYIYASVYGGIVCCACSLPRKPHFRVVDVQGYNQIGNDPVVSLFRGLKHKGIGRKFYKLRRDRMESKKVGLRKKAVLQAREPVYRTYTGILSHVKAHQAAGNTIPDYAIERLREEQAAAFRDQANPLPGMRFKKKPAPVVRKHRRR